MSLVGGFSGVIKDRTERVFGGLSWLLRYLGGTLLG